MTHVKIKPGQVDEFRKAYDAEIVPTVTAQEGNTGIYLLEPDQVAEELVSVTVWQDRESGDAYETGGTYAALTEKVRHLIAERPAVQSYSLRD